MNEIIKHRHDDKITLRSFAIFAMHWIGAFSIFELISHFILSKFKLLIQILALKPN